VLKKLPGIISSICIQPLITAEMLIQAKNIYMQTAGTEQDFVTSLIKGIDLTGGRVNLIMQMPLIRVNLLTVSRPESREKINCINSI